VSQVWVVVLSNLIAILLQTLAARLGLVTGKHLAQVTGGGRGHVLQHQQCSRGALPHRGGNCSVCDSVECIVTVMCCQVAHQQQCCIPVLMVCLLRVLRRFPPLQVCREAYPPVVCVLLWVLCEVSIVALDLTMVLGEWQGRSNQVVATNSRGLCHLCCWCCCHTA
jgi:hypothetical protein